MSNISVFLSAIFTRRNLLIFGGGVFIYHLLTLSISPLPWTDEVFFNSLSLDWWKTGHFRFWVDKEMYSNHESYTYGPIFFWLNGTIIGLLGDNPFSGRLLGVISAFLLIILIYKWAKPNKEQGWLIFIPFVLLLADPFFNSSMNKGRNDLTAILFFYSAAYLLIKAADALNNRNKLSYHWVLFAIAYSSSILTSARMLMITPALGILFIAIFFNSKQKVRLILYSLLAGLLISLLYLIWIYWAFGGINGYLEYYKKASQVAGTSFVGSWLFIPVEVKLLLVVFVVIASLTAVRLAIKRELPLVMIFVIALLIDFYTIVGDMGPYSIIVIPGIYLFIVCAIPYIREIKTMRYVTATFFFFLFLFNFGTFLYKGAVLLTDMKARSPQMVEKFVSDNIPPGDNVRVCMDEIYYYAVLANKDNPHLMFSYDPRFDTVENYSRTVFNYDYLIISKRIETRYPELIKDYKERNSLEPVAVLNTPHSRLAAFFSSRTGYDFSASGYDGTIYRKKKQ